MINKILKECSEIQKKADAKIYKKIDEMIQHSGVKEVVMRKENVYDDNNYYDSLCFVSVNGHVLNDSSTYAWEELKIHKVKKIILKIKSKKEALAIIESATEIPKWTESFGDDEFTLQVAAICYHEELAPNYLIDLMTSFSYDVELRHLERFMNGY